MRAHCNRSAFGKEFINDEIEICRLDMYQQEKATGQTRGKMPLKTVLTAMADNLGQEVRRTESLLCGTHSRCVTIYIDKSKAKL